MPQTDIHMFNGLCLPNLTYAIRFARFSGVSVVSNMLTATWR